MIENHLGRLTSEVILSLIVLYLVKLFVPEIKADINTDHNKVYNVEYKNISYITTDDF